MRIVFIGAVYFSKRALQHLIYLNADIVGVCTLRASSSNSDHVDLSKIAAAARIPVLFSSDINSQECINWISKLKPDIIFCFGWSRLVRQPLLNLAPMGVLGFHPSLLPKNRGRHPIIWALVLGLSETASTFFFMDEGADSGDILSQVPISISQDDDASSLYERICEAAMNQLQEFLPNLISKNFTRVSQADGASNSWRKRTNLDGIIDWRMSANSIYNLVRGLSHPYVGAQFIYNSAKITVWKCRVNLDQPVNYEFGKVVNFGEDGPIIKAGSDAIELVDYEPQLKIEIGEYL